MRKRLTSAARCAIKMRNRDPDRNVVARLLERYLLNGPLHCFGYHDKCSTDFCSTACRNQLNAGSNAPLSNPSSACSTSSGAVDDDDETSIGNSGLSDDIEGIQSYM